MVFGGAPAALAQADPRSPQAHEQTDAAAVPATPTRRALREEARGEAPPHTEASPARTETDDAPRSPMDAAARSGFARYRDALDFAENAFAFGDFDAVIRTLEPWLYPSPVLDSAAQTSSDGYGWLGASAWFNDNPDAAHRYFEAGLRAHRTMLLDPLIFPPELVQYFREIREAMLPPTNDPRAPREDNTIYIESRVAEHPRWVSMLPFGYGMFVNGESEWGITYALTEASLLAVSASLFWVNYSRRLPSDDPAQPMGYADPRRAEMRRRVHIGTGAGFIGLVVINMIHGAVIHNREQRVQYRTLSAPPEGFSDVHSQNHRRRWNIQVAPIFAAETGQFHSTW